MLEKVEKIIMELMLECAFKQEQNTVMDLKNWAMSELTKEFISCCCLALTDELKEHNSMGRDLTDEFEEAFNQHTYKQLMKKYAELKEEQ